MRLCFHQICLISALSLWGPCLGAHSVDVNSAFIQLKRSDTIFTQMETLPFGFHSDQISAGENLMAGPPRAAEQHWFCATALPELVWKTRCPSCIVPMTTLCKAAPYQLPWLLHYIWQPCQRATSNPSQRLFFQLTRSVLWGKKKCLFKIAVFWLSENKTLKLPTTQTRRAPLGLVCCFTLCTAIQ